MSRDAYARVLEAREYQEQFFGELSDAQFLQWVRNRLIFQHHEPRDSVFINHLQAVIQRTKENQ